MLQILTEGNSNIQIIYTFLKSQASFISYLISYLSAATYNFLCGLYFTAEIRADFIWRSFFFHSFPSEFLQDKNMNAPSAVCCDDDEDDDEDGEAADMEGISDSAVRHTSLLFCSSLPHFSFNSRIRGERPVGNRRGRTLSPSLIIHYIRCAPPYGCLSSTGHSGHQ